MTAAQDARRPPGAQASPPCPGGPRRPLPQRAGPLQRAAGGAPPPAPSRAAETPASGPSGIEEQPQERAEGGLNKHTGYPEGPELLPEAAAGGERDTRQQEPRRGQVRPDPGGRALPAAGDPLQATPRPGDLAGRADDGNVGLPPKREAERGDRSVQGSGARLHGAPQPADVRVPQEDRGTAAQLREQKRTNRELAAEITRLRAEKASLQRENANLKDEIQRLTQRLRAPPGAQGARAARLRAQLLREAARRRDLERGLPAACRDLSATSQFLGTYKKMARDLNRELQRSTCYYQNEIRCHQKRAEEAWTAADANERKLEGLRRENDRSRRMLAAAGPKVQPLPPGPLAPAAPPTARGGPEVPGRPLAHRVPRRKAMQ